MERMMKTLLMIGCVLAPLAAWAEPTSVTVRALAHDAKLIPGVDITVTDTDSGRVLARGATEGGTGDTGLIMKEPVARGEPVYATEGAAAFTAQLDLNGPRLVEITASQRGTGASASRTLWLFPGQDVTGNGVLLELYGLNVDLHAPTGGEVVPGEAIPVTAEVRMLCGCPVVPDGLWDANGFSIRAELLRDGRVVAAEVLPYAGETSMFAGELPMPEAGDYRLRVSAGQPARGNFGVAETAITVRE